MFVSGPPSKQGRSGKHSPAVTASTPRASIYLGTAVSRTSTTLGQLTSLSRPFQNLPSPTPFTIIPPNPEVDLLTATRQSDTGSLVPWGIPHTPVPSHPPCQTEQNPTVPETPTANLTPIGPGINPPAKTAVAHQPCRDKMSYRYPANPFCSIVPIIGLHTWEVQVAGALRRFCSTCAIMRLFGAFFCRDLLHGDGDVYVIGSRLC
jgi:hypothetical protein